MEVVADGGWGGYFRVVNYPLEACRSLILVITGVFSTSEFFGCARKKVVTCVSCHDLPRRACPSAHGIARSAFYLSLALPVNPRLATHVPLLTSKVEGEACHYRGHYVPRNAL